MSFTIRLRLINDRTQCRTKTTLYKLTFGSNLFTKLSKTGQIYVLLVTVFFLKALPNIYATLTHLVSIFLLL